MQIRLTYDIRFDAPNGASFLAPRRLYASPQPNLGAARCAVPPGNVISLNGLDGAF